MVLLLAAIRGDLRQLFKSKSGSDSWGGLGEEDGAAGGPSAGYQAVNADDDGHHETNQFAPQGAWRCQNTGDMQQSGQQQQFSGYGIVADEQQTGFDKQSDFPAAVFVGAGSKSSSERSRSKNGSGSGRSSP